MSDRCHTQFRELRWGEVRRISLPRTWVNRGKKKEPERDASEHQKRARQTTKGAGGGGGVLTQDAASFWFGYSSTAASLGAFDEWAFRLSSATSKASSSKLASWVMFHTCAIITGQ